MLPNPRNEELKKLKVGLENLASKFQEEVLEWEQVLNERTSALANGEGMDVNSVSSVLPWDENEARDAQDILAMDQKASSATTYMESLQQICARLDNVKKDLEETELASKKLVENLNAEIMTESRPKALIRGLAESAGLDEDDDEI